jgi:hypothetical protein
MNRIIILLFVSLMFASCSELVDGLNENPNSPTTSAYQNILTGAEVGNTLFQSGEAARKAGIFCGYYTGIDRQHEGFSEYAVTTSDFDNQWNDAFVNTIANAIVAEETAAEAGIVGVTRGITTIIRAFGLGTSASLWGSIPFDEAGRPSFENPAFEGQIEVYDKLQNLLDQAIADLESGTGRPAIGSDIHFDGAPQAWIEVAHSLKARFYMHTKNYEMAYAEAQMGISSPANDLITPHGSALGNANLNYQFFAIASRQADLVTADFIASFVIPDEADNPIFSNYRGNAKTDETARYNYLFEINSFGIQPNTGDGFAAQEEPTRLITYHENLLTLAEAGFRTQGFDTGLTHLNEFRAYMAGGGYLSNADVANIRYDAYDAADFESGGMENEDGIAAEDALLREILEERYVTFFGHIEGFNDTRRTLKESTVRVPVPPNTGTQLPQRFLYPTTEIDRNPNVPSPVPDFFEPTPVNQ